MKTHQFFKIFSLLVLTLLNSCASRQDIAYFQDEAISSAMVNSSLNFELRFKTDDLLTINISALDPEVVKPFNIPATYVNKSIVEAEGSLKMQTYLIDSNGNIEFPVLGTLKIAGNTRSEANIFLKKKLEEYIVNPIVNIRLVNFTITVLGEVANPGTYTVETEKISFARAIGLAGDLTIHGKRNNVLLIREVDGVKKYHKFDLTSVNVVNSSNYYLTQNDIIYVEPNKAKIRSSSYNQNNGIIIAAVGTLATIVAILIK